MSHAPEGIIANNSQAVSEGQPIFDVLQELHTFGRYLSLYPNLQQFAPGKVITYMLPEHPGWMFTGEFSDSRTIMVNQDGFQVTDFLIKRTGAKTI